MDFDRNNVMLRYEIFGRDEEPRLRLLMLKQGGAVFFRTEETRRDPEGPDVFLSVSSEATEAVKRILSDSRLYELGGV